MPKALILGTDQRKIKRLATRLPLLNEWAVHTIDISLISLVEINKSLSEENIQFILLLDTINSLTLTVVEHIRTLCPLIEFVYYNHFLEDRLFGKIYEAGIHSCIIGNDQHANLAKYLNNLWKNHWQRVPLSKICNDKLRFTPRAQKIIKFIENNSLDNFTIPSIAQYLNISESHCRAEIRRLLGINFRQFKQRMLQHYESVLLFEKKLKPGEVYQILNYRSLPTFSRSFKSRHGSSWRYLKYNSKELID